MALRCGPLLPAAVAVLFGAATGQAAEDPRITTDVAPVLVQKCQDCRGPDKAKGDYRVDTFERLTKPGGGGAAPVTPGRSELAPACRRGFGDRQGERRRR